MSKNIIICYDGTGNEYGKNNTNVVKTFESIVRDEKQVAFYDPGVGTFSYLGRNLGKRVGKVLGLAFGAGLQQNLEDGYEYLMNRFEKDDKVFILGFSRGAYTARALAGMIYRFGVLQKGSKNLIPYVSDMYIKRKFDLSSNFKEAFCQHCEPHFIGVWDTVGSMGLFWGKKFFDQKLNKDVKNAFHAMSTDEKRKKFPVNMWDENAKTTHQNIEQVWFTGVHSDVGGYYDERGLSDIAFAWMMDKAEACGMILKESWKDSLVQDCTDKLHNSRKGFYKLWRKRDRKIPDGAKIHKSVFDRIKEVEDYRPTNLLDEHDKGVTNESYPK